MKQVTHLFWSKRQEEICRQYYETYYPVYAKVNGVTVRISERKTRPEGELLVSAFSDAVYLGIEDE